MPGRPQKVDHLRLNLAADIESARSLATAALQLQAVNQPGRLHPKHVRRIVELAFLGVVAEWDGFVEQAFVRYLCGAATNTGCAPTLAVGRARNIQHAYAIVSQSATYNPTQQYLRFSDARWTLQKAGFFFAGVTPFDALRAHLARLQDAVAIRNRVAHNSSKSRADFKGVALAYVNPGGGTLSQGYRAGDLLLTPATRHFGGSPITPGRTYFDAFLDMYDQLALRVVP